MSSLESTSRMNLAAGNSNALASNTNGITSTAVSVGAGEGGVGGVAGVSQAGNPAAAPANDYKLYQQQTGGSTPAHHLPLHAIPLLNNLPHNHNPIYQQPMGIPAQPQQYRYYGDQYQYYQGAPASSATPAAANGPSAPAAPAPNQYPYYMYNQQASYPYNYYQGQGQPTGQPAQHGSQPGAQQSQPPRQVPPLQNAGPAQAAPGQSASASAASNGSNGASSTDTSHGAGAAHGAAHGGPGAGAPPELALTVGQYQPPGIRPRVTTTMWEDEKTLCYQVDANNVSVVRRADNNMINGTKLLNVAQMTRGRRDGILKLEKVRHVVKIGLMHLKGVWIPFERALAMAQREGIVDLLYPLFVRDIKRVIQTGILPPKLSSMYYDQSQIGQQNVGRQLSGSAPPAAQYAAPQTSHQEQGGNGAAGGGSGSSTGGGAAQAGQSQHGQPVYGYQQYYTPTTGQYYAYNGYSYNNQVYPYQQYAKPKDEKDEAKKE